MSGKDGLDNGILMARILAELSPLSRRNDANRLVVDLSDVVGVLRKCFET